MRARVALLYSAITVAMTWPVAARIDRDLPSDLGDPAFVAGVIAWGAEHWLALMSGDIAAAGRFWTAPIFHPEPLTLAYSEHFALHALLTFPVYAVTRNPVLCYNLAFLASFVIGGLGMYLLVRDLTGPRDRFHPAAFVAGLAWAFAPYRIATLPHLQVLSSQWMPFVLLGLHRYFRTRSSDALVGAGAALWAQNMSSGYYMLYFGPFVALYAVVEIALRKLWRDARVWRDLVVTAAVSVAAILPFALPYLERTRGTRRTFSEVVAYSADLQAWVTASERLHLWGGLQTLVKAEGLLFPGITVVALAAIALTRGWRVSRSGVMFGALALLLSVWLSLGPQVQLDTQPVGIPSLYALLTEFPGFSASRVPARFATIAVMALAVLAGIALSRWNEGRARVVPAIAGVLILIEGAAFPLPTNATWTSAPAHIAPPPARLYRLADAPPVFRYLARLDANAAIVHFPFGLPEREIQYGYYAMMHGRRIVNGYSGAFPPSYNMRLGVLANPTADPTLVETILDVDGVTHAVVHGAAYLDDGGAAVMALLESLGWKRAARYEDDYVLVR